MAMTTDCFNEKDKILIVLLGPTGVGKTELSLGLAEHFHSSIISADSRQLYRDLPIGTAAPSQQDLLRVPHYFVGQLALDQYFNAWNFESEVQVLLQRLFLSQNVVFMSGGSMMYIDAVCNGIDYLPNVNNEIRQQLMLEFEQQGLAPLQARLKDLDPDYYNVVDLHNHKRVLHALEICLTSGKTYTSFRKNVKKERPYRILKIGLCRDRAELYERINLRVDSMMQNGLLEEARKVFPFRKYNSLNTVGYKELFHYLEGDWTLDFAVEKIKQNTRIYSRKQMTWFKKDPEIVWFHPNESEKIYQWIVSQGVSCK